LLAIILGVEVRGVASFIFDPAGQSAKMFLRK
jgi:hypothetical protein